MERETAASGATTPQVPVYLDVSRLADGRYCVQFVKDGAPSRTSYAGEAEAVVRQAQRAGNIPVRTRDAELRHACESQLVDLLV